jgi:hypothetical protein
MAFSAKFMTCIFRLRFLTDYLQGDTYDTLLPVLLVNVKPEYFPVPVASVDVISRWNFFISLQHYSSSPVM